MAPDNEPTLYIIYNATSNLFGKLNYAYRKTTNSDPASKPACAACELTHGPALSLSESSEWASTKARIQNVNISQVHTDERPAVLARWMKQSGISTPAVVVDTVSHDESNRFRALMTSEDLARVRLQHGQFLDLLRDRAAEAGVTGMVVK